MEEWIMLPSGHWFCSKSVSCSKVTENSEATGFISRTALPVTPLYLHFYIDLRCRSLFSYMPWYDYYHSIGNSRKSITCGRFCLVCCRLSLVTFDVVYSAAFFWHFSSFLLLQGTPGVTGSVMWDSGIVLGKFLEHAVDSGTLVFQGKKVVELGSGCGLVGYVVSQLLKNTMFHMSLWNT